MNTQLDMTIDQLIRKRLLVVEDDIHFVGALSRALSDTFDISHVSSVEQAKQAIDETIAAVILDLYLGDSDSDIPSGFEFLGWLASNRLPQPTIVVTGYGNKDLIVKATRLGAEDFIDKGRLDFLELESRLLSAIESRARLAEVEDRLSVYEPRVLIGNSDVMHSVRRAIRSVARESESSILITGEAGTGKELAARMIHDLGERNESPFVHLDCRTLASSESVNDIQKLTIKANAGVLFLDEIAELPDQHQLFVLSIIKSADHRRVDPQIVASASRRLDEQVRSGGFRRDLHTLLGLFEIRLPPLREHIDDITDLVDYFATNRAPRSADYPVQVHADVIRAFEKYEWPGNVSELRNVIESAALKARLSNSREMLPDHLPADFNSHGTPGSAADDLNVDTALARAELECVIRALIRTGGRKDQALKLLGYGSRHAMLRRIRAIRSRYPEIWALYPKIESLYGPRGN